MLNYSGIQRKNKTDVHFQRISQGFDISGNSGGFDQLNIQCLYLKDLNIKLTFIFRGVYTFFFVEPRVHVETYCTIETLSRWRRYFYLFVSIQHIKRHNLTKLLSLVCVYYFSATGNGKGKMYSAPPGVWQQPINRLPARG